MVCDGVCSFSSLGRKKKETMSYSSFKRTADLLLDVSEEWIIGVKDETEV